MHALRARRPDDAIDRRPRSDDIAKRSDGVQHRDFVTDDRSCTLEKRCERQLRRSTHARRIVEELAQQELHPARLGRRPVHERGDEAVDIVHVVESGEQLRADVVQERRVELLLAREVIDDGREWEARRGRDVAHARTVKTARHEQLLGRLQDANARTLAFRRMTAIQHNGTTVP